MDAVSIHEAKAHFARLVARAEAGEEIVVRRGATPVAKIVAYTPPSAPQMQGGPRVDIARSADELETARDDFDDYVA
jgi:prevent-host-death family protein